MNQKINNQYHYICIVVIAYFFFFWGVDFKVPFLKSDFVSGFRLSYLIIILIIPISYKCIKSFFLLYKQKFNYEHCITIFKEIFNYQRYIIFFTLFIIAHFFFIKIYYQEIIDLSEIKNLVYLLLLSVIYCHYRNFIFVNFKKILIFYLITFVLLSFYEGSQKFNLGQCNSNFFLIDLIQNFLEINFSNSLYLENSHLAMMTIAFIFSFVLILIQDTKNTILLLLIFLISIIILLNNLSTTFFVGYLISQITLLLFLFKKIDIKYWIITISFLFLNSYLFLSDKNCVKKIQDFKVENIVQNNLEKGNTNLTTLVYQRSIIVAKKTIIHHSLGWGIDGMDNATLDLLDDYSNSNPDASLRVTLSGNVRMDEYNRAEARRTPFWMLRMLNLKDGLSNGFKMITEFGIFTFIILFYFIKYIINIKDIKPYNLFIIVLFITLCIRGAGYFSGGFIFCLLEFFYHKKFIIELEFNKKS